MPYLTYTEYIDMGFSQTEKTEFDRLLKKASDVINGVTRDFYQFYDLADDLPYRRDKFKKAVAAQIEYFNDMGATSSHGLNEPSSVAIGRTTVSSGRRGSQGAQEPQNAIVSKDARMYLSGTGLLNKSIGVI